MIWNCLHTVKARAARFSFGVTGRVIYDPVLPSHGGRKLTRGPEGVDWVFHFWNRILSKVCYPVHTSWQLEIVIDECVIGNRRA